LFRPGQGPSLAGNVVAESEIQGSGRIVGKPEVTIGGLG